MYNNYNGCCLTVFVFFCLFVFTLCENLSVALYGEDESAVTQFIKQKQMRRIDNDHMYMLIYLFS